MDKHNAYVGVIAFITGGAIFSALTFFLANQSEDSELQREIADLEAKRQEEIAAKIDSRLRYGAFFADGWECAETESSSACVFQKLEAEPSLILKRVDLESGHFSNLYIKEFGDERNPHMVARFGWETDCDVSTDYAMNVAVSTGLKGTSYSNAPDLGKQEMTCRLIDKKTFLLGSIVAPINAAPNLPELLSVPAFNWGGFEGIAMFDLWPHELIFQSYSLYKNSSQDHAQPGDAPTKKACRRMREEAVIEFSCLQ